MWGISEIYSLRVLRSLLKTCQGCQRGSPPWATGADTGSPAAFLVGVPLRLTPTRVPMRKIFIAALMSLSWWLPHSGQSHSLMFKGNFSTMCPQSDQRLELGKYRSILINSRPYHSALYSNCLTNSPQLASDTHPSCSPPRRGWGWVVVFHHVFYRIINN